LFSEAFRITFSGVGQTFILAAIGFFLIRRKLLGEEGLNALSRLVIEVTLPFLMFCRIVREFDFRNFPQWWLFPLISIGITALGLLIGWFLTGFIGGQQRKLQFLSLISFQNSGYLPLFLVASMLSPDKRDVMFIYLFLFLLGFNLLMFSLGVYLLTFTRAKKFDYKTLANPPVVATLAGLIVVFFNAARFIPGWLLAPLQSAGDTSLPLAILVVGGNLAVMHFDKVDIKAMSLLVLAKLIVLPALGLWLIFVFKLPELVGLLIVMQLAMPAATNLSVITSMYKKEDVLITQGIFISHLVSLITIPVFLSFYFMINMIQ